MVNPRAAPYAGEEPPDMSLLQDLLTQDHVVSAERMEDALRRQRAAGGDLATCLLEVGAVGEDTLAAYCGAVHSLRPAPRADIVEADPAEMARIPTELAVTAGAVALFVDESDVLQVAVAAPLDDAMLARLEQAAGRKVSLRVVTPFRLAWALWRYYGTALDARTAALAETLYDSDPGPMPLRPSSRRESVVAAPAAEAPTPSQSPGGGRVLRSLAALLDDEDDDEDEDEVAPHDPHDRPTSEALTPVVRPAAPTMEKPTAEAAEQSAPRSAPPSTRPLPKPAGSADRLRLPGTREALAAPLVPKFDAPAPTSSLSPAPPAAPVAPPAAPEEVLSLPEAEAHLAAAEDRDAIIAAMLRHAVQDFAYAALFVVRGERAEGLASRGRGADSAAVRAVPVVLAEGSAARRARDTAQAVVTRVGADTPEAVLRAALGRDEADEVVLLPVPIQGKSALLLWVDAGPHRPGVLSVRALEAFVGRCGQAFERLVAARKQGASLAPPRDRRTPAPVRLPSAPTPTPAPSEAPRARPGQPSAEARMAALRAAVLGPGNARRSVPPTGSSAAASRGARTPLRSAPPRSATPGPTTPRPLTPRPATPRPGSLGATPAVPESVGPRMGTLADAEQRVAEVARTGILTDDTAATLLAMGERALEAVFRHFPGPHLPVADRGAARLASADELGPVIRLALRFRAAAVPWLLGVLDRGDAEARLCALACLAEVAHPSALPAMTSLFLDGDHTTRLAVVDAFKAFLAFPEFESVARTLRTLVRDPRSQAEVRRMAAYALGELRDVAAIPALIDALVDGDAALVTAAQLALVTLSRQDFGPDVDAWRGWWERSGGRHRIEWLMEALLHAEATLRHAASEELKQVTGQFFGYYFNLPRRERERAQQRYVAWWRREGALRFTGKPAP